MAKAFTPENVFIDEDRELKLLAAIIQDPTLYYDVSAIMPIEALSPISRDIYRQIVNAIENNLPMPILEVEPSQYSTSDADILAELYKKKQLADLVFDIGGKLAGDTATDNIMDDLQSKLSNISETFKGIECGQLLNFYPLINMATDELAEQGDKIKTGIKRLDVLLGGLQTGIHLLAAEPGKGKTTLALNIAVNVSKQGIPVLFISFEETLERLALKALCIEASIQLKVYTDGYKKLDDLDNAANSEWISQNLQNLYFVQGNSKLTLQNVLARVLQMQSHHKRSMQAQSFYNTDKCLVIVDYLQRWASVQRQGFNDFRHDVTALVGGLREMALKINNPVIAICSQNRDGQGRSSLTSLKESGDLEYSADSAMFLVDDTNRRPSGTARPVKLQIEKNRFGDKGFIEFNFKAELGRFEEIPAC